MDRRQFLQVIGSAAGAALLSSCQRQVPHQAHGGKRLLVLAFDGLDPRIVADLMQSGRLPNFARVAATGSFRKLGTSSPAQTPVAFANIISGTDPGTHQIFDFIHRDPRPIEPGLAVRPFFSAAEALPVSHAWAIPLGRWRLPLTGGHVRSLRRGPAFWEALVRHGIDTTVYRVPSNYPPSPVEGPGQFRCISGMGTPDLLGTNGLFTMFTPDAPVEGRQVGGGQFVRLDLVHHHGQARLIGPENPLLQSCHVHTLQSVDRRARLQMALDIEIARDPAAPVAKIEIDGKVLLLNEGEWSEWVQLEFDTGIPGGRALRAAGAPSRLPGMVRFFLKRVHPKLELYASPINLDPSRPITKISEPDWFAAELARRHGLYYTTGIPEDTKALSHGAFTEDQFLQQTDLVMREQTQQYQAALREFRQGCLFYYFGWPDLMQHMFWRDRDPQHPGYDPRQAERYGHVVDDVYVRLDRLVGEALDVLHPDDDLMILSDHGFTSFRRGFNLNTWLAENGYIARADGGAREQAELFAGVDWSATRAYGLGMNAVYLNLWGREKYGTVRPPAVRALLTDLRDRLLAVRDDDGAPVIESIDLVQDVYPAADPAVAPDMIIGYADGYGASWETILGGMPPRLIEDNLDRWSGTHLISPNLIPGILITNRKVDVGNPTVTDVAPSILSVFGVPAPAQMTGKSVFDG